MSNPADNNDVVILAAARTPQGRLNGQLASFTAVELGTHAIRAALAASGVKAERDMLELGATAGERFARTRRARAPSVPASAGTFPR